MAEVLAAVLILSIGLLAILSSIVASRDTQQRASWLCIGRTIAYHKMEYVRSAAAAAVDGLNTTEQDMRLPAGNQIRVTVTRYPDSSQTKMFLATVTVTWPEGNGTRTLKHESFICKI